MIDSQWLTWIVHTKGYSLTKLSQDCQIKNDWRCKQWIFTCVVNDNRITTTHHQLTNVLIHCTFRIAHIWNILDHHCMIWMRLSLTIQDLVRIDHVIDNVRFRNFLASKLFRCHQIVSVIVSQMIVTNNRTRFDASADQKVDQYRFEFGLSRFEIITRDENLIAFSQFDQTRNECVLRWSIDVGRLFYKYIKCYFCILI